MMRVSLSPRADLDLEEIGDYIARDNPSRALSFVEELAELCRGLGFMPEAYHVREELGPDIRVVPHGNHLIIYRILPGAAEVRIERVVRGSRLLAPLL